MHGDPEMLQGRNADHDEEEFLAALESCRLGNEEFHHSDHIRLAWLYLERYDEAAPARMRRTLAAFAAHHGHADRYHETLTLAWMHLVASARSLCPAITFQDFIIRNAALLDARLPFRYYSERLLMSDGARRGWVGPDLEPLPSGPPPPEGVDTAAYAADESRSLR